ncbi:CCA tRNA nucleotidyltransferase, mitochondrial [Mayamaea pseudoterrestris]|nr:CCA tRNA nucleotidyltransferase, mitochondrial [Mayamaea pseudoterrestris]
MNHETLLALTESDVSVPTTVIVMDSNHECLPPRFSTKHAQIVLTPQEDELFDLLTRVMNDYNNSNGNNGMNGEHMQDDETAHQCSSSSQSSTPPSQQNNLLQVRVAGGWVRDKLLGRMTQDIDVTVNCISGVDFARRVVDCVSKEREQHENEQVTRKLPHVAVISANPDQSKHLETATFSLRGMDIDVCALRSHTEVYQDSRIPASSTGTPLSDAMRRDFTMNALFYNLQTKRVEDWTRRGIFDLMKGVIVTPPVMLMDDDHSGSVTTAATPDGTIAPPLHADEDLLLEQSAYSTFHDDPLRVLRAVRFGVRYNYQLHSSIIKAAQTLDIHVALHQKVSRERVGKELVGMMKSCDMAVRALRMMWELKLAGSVFILPTTSECGNDDNGVVTLVHGRIAGNEYPTKGSHGVLEAAQAHVRELGWVESMRLLGLLPQVMQAYHETKSVTANNVTPLDEFLLPLATFLLPFRKLLYEQGKTMATLKQYSVVRYMVRDSIKFPNKHIHAIGLLMDHVDAMSALLQDWGAFAFNMHATASGRATMSESAVDKQTAQFRLQAGLLLRATKDLWVTCLLLASIILPGDDPALQRTHATMAIYQLVLSLGLDECWKTKPILDGKAIMTTLALPKGPQVGGFMEEQVRWMLMHPHGNEADLVQHLRLFQERLQQEQGSNDSVDGNLKNQPTVDGGGTRPAELMNTSLDSAQHVSKRMHVE